VIAYRATLDVPRELVQFVARLLWAERRRRGTPKGSRALTCFWEAVLVLRWFRGRTSPDALARDHGVSRATAYRYLDEVIEVLASQTPGLRQALERAKDEGFSHVILDGAIIPAHPARPRPDPPRRHLGTSRLIRRPDPAQRPAPQKGPASRPRSTTGDPGARPPCRRPRRGQMEGLSRSTEARQNSPSSAGS
jgi:hypothetical protein